MILWRVDGPRHFRRARPDEVTPRLGDAERVAKIRQRVERKHCSRPRHPVPEGPIRMTPDEEYDFYARPDNQTP